MIINYIIHMVASVTLTIVIWNIEQIINGTEYFTTIPTYQAVLISDNGFWIKHPLNLTLHRRPQNQSSSSRISVPPSLYVWQHMTLSSCLPRADRKKPMTDVSRLFSCFCWLYLNHRASVHTPPLSFLVFPELYRPSTPWTRELLSLQLVFQTSTNRWW